MIPTLPVYVVDFMKDIVTAMQDVVNSEEVLSQIKAAETQALGSTKIEVIDFQYGHKLELIETLLQMDKDPDMRTRKYPCVYLVQDFVEERGNPDWYAKVYLNVIIMHQTLQAYKITDRYAKVFKPVLYPLYYSLLTEICKNPQCNEYPPDSIVHTKIDRSYWGRNDNVEKNMLNDFVDAIEIENLSLKLNFNC